jgi:hypothetical protein
MYVCGFKDSTISQYLLLHRIMHIIIHSNKIQKKKKKKEFGGESVTFNVSRICGGI